MNSKFWYDMKNLDNVTTTTNGDKAYKSSLNGLMDLMFKGGVMKNCSADEAIRLFKGGYDINPVAAIRLLFYIRDIRGGQGCRNFFRQNMIFLAQKKPEVFKLIFKYIPEYGRWDDLITICKEQLNDDVINCIIDFIREQLFNDINTIKEKENTKPISLLLKWMPSENTSSKDTVKLAKFIRKKLNFDSKTYRKMLSTGRNYLKIVEHNVCSNNFKDLDYSTVPSKAMVKYKNIFLNKDNEHFNSYINSLVKGETKVNASTLYPYDIISELRKTNERAQLDLLNEQWKALPNFFGNKSDNSLVVADVSGSMCGIPLTACISLALYIAERNKGIFHNKVITFSEQPSLVQLSKSFTDLTDRMKELENINWGMNTNIDKVFNLIFNACRKQHRKEDIPSTLYIISDMQFDECCEDSSMSVFEKWTNIFNINGMTLPKIVFWNVSEDNCNTCPVTVNENNVLCISGFSPSILKFIMDGDYTNTISLIENIVLNRRYSNILSEITDYNIFN